MFFQILIFYVDYLLTFVYSVTWENFNLENKLNVFLGNESKFLVLSQIESNQDMNRVIFELSQIFIESKQIFGLALSSWIESTT